MLGDLRLSIFWSWWVWAELCEAQHEWRQQLYWQSWVLGEEVHYLLHFQGLPHYSGKA